MITIKEIDETLINSIITLDRKLSWELLDHDIKEQLGWDEFVKRHENIFKNLYKSSTGSQIILGAFDNNTLIGYAWIELRLDRVPCGEVEANDISPRANPADRIKNTHKYLERSSAGLFRG